MDGIECAGGVDGDAGGAVEEVLHDPAGARALAEPLVDQGVGDIGETSIPPHTGSRASRAIGLTALPVMALWALYGLVWSPPDAAQGEAVRLFYVHVPIATLLSVACLVTTVSSAMWLRRRSPGWDALAVAGGELAVLFGVLTLVTGAVWGRPTWGTYWSWDPRLTTSALLVVLAIGYLALRGVAPNGGVGGSVPAAIVGLLLLPNALLVRYSIDLWDGLHQTATISTFDVSMEGDMLVAWWLGLLSGILVFVWLLIHRFRVAHLEQQVDRYDLGAAVAARRAEAGRKAEEDDS
jgi:heme exporter protein C